MKLCTCRNCDHVFTAIKVEAFCSGRCRHSYTLTNPKPTANRDGANINETTSNNS
ncbi:hypothetical protein D3C80_2139830 [compost metagenome]